MAAHVCQQLLARGYAVRGTVRSAAKGQFLADLFKSPRFEFVIVEDIEKEGAFDACLVGVEGIAHTVIQILTSSWASLTTDDDRPRPSTLT